MTPELEGKSLLDIKDADGGFPFREMLAQARSNGGGYAVYHWKKPGDSGETAQKTSYVLAIPELGLMIGSGVYLDDIFSQIFGVVARIALMVAPLLALFIGFAWFVGHTISHRLADMTTALREMAQGNYDIELPGLDREDELSEMARAIDAFKNGLRETARTQSDQREDQRRSAQQARSNSMQTLAQNFETAIGGVVGGRDPVDT